jgi:hypothetical protein
MSQRVAARDLQRSTTKECSISQVDGHYTSRIAVNNTPSLVSLERAHADPITATTPHAKWLKLGSVGKLARCVQRDSTPIQHHRPEMTMMGVGMRNNAPGHRHWVVVFI